MRLYSGVRVIPSAHQAFSFSLGIINFIEIKGLFELCFCDIGRDSFNHNTFVLDFTSLEGFEEDLTFWPKAVFILDSFCKIFMSCIESPITVGINRLLEVP